MKHPREAQIRQSAALAGYQLRELRETERGRHGERWIMKGRRANLLVIDLDEAEALVQTIMENRKTRKR